MKMFLQYFLVLIPALLFSNCSGNAQSPNNIEQESKADRIEVLDFHTDHRCKTCLTIEKLTQQLLDETYAPEMEEGTIQFQLINVDEKENFPLAQKFGAFGTSLIINVRQDGQESYVDLTEFAFMNVNDEEKFKKGLQEKIDDSLKKLQL